MVYKPRILLVTTGPLLPTDAGGRIYTWGTTAPLRDRFEYHLIGLMTAAEREQFRDDEARLDAGYSEAFASWQFFDRPEIPGHMSRGDALRHLWFHSRHRLPLMDISYYSTEVVDAARRVVVEKGIDLVEVDHAEMAFVRRFIPEVPAVLVNHNIEGDLHPFWMTERWNLAEKVVWRAFAGISRANTRAVEIANAFGFAAKTFISPIDAARVGEQCPKVVVPVPMPIRPVVRTPGQRLRMLWLGGMNWPPNLEGVRWLLEQILPGLHDEAVELHVVGGSPPPDVVRHHDGDRVQIHGYVADVTSHLAAADVLLAPIFTGSGVNLKVVEAMAAGMPVITTSVGLAGLSAQPGRDLLVADDAAGFLDAVRNLSRGPQLRVAIGEAALAYVRAHHHPDEVNRIKEAALRSALAAAGKPVG